MRISSARIREETGVLIKDLRGLAIEYNAALATASQSNREGAGAKTVTALHAAEDFSKVATSDIVISYSRTQFEYELNLARLTVNKSRDDFDKFTVLLSQAYAVGQFCTDAVMLPGGYWDATGLDSIQKNGN